MHGDSEGAPLLSRSRLVLALVNDCRTSTLLSVETPALERSSSPHGHAHDLELFFRTLLCAAFAAIENPKER